MTIKIKALTNYIYDILGMKGVVRIDYIINQKDTPYLIEINSIPGMSKESIIPQMAKVKKIKMKEILL